jgi:hypothetical protein
MLYIYFLATETSLTSTQPGPDPSSGIAALLYRPPLDPTQPVRDSSIDTAAPKNRTPLDPTRPVQDPSSGLGALKNQNPLESSQISTSGPYHEHPTIDLSPGSVRQCRLQRTPDDSGFGFNLTPGRAIGEGHQIGLVTPLSPAARQGIYNMKRVLFRFSLIFFISKVFVLVIILKVLTMKTLNV